MKNIWKDHNNASIAIATPLIIPLTPEQQRAIQGLTRTGVHPISSQVFVNNFAAQPPDLIVFYLHYSSVELNHATGNVINFLDACTYEIQLALHSHSVDTMMIDISCV